jgi:molecular chaperone DnaK
MGQAMYAANAEASAAGAGPTGESDATGGGDEDVVDAEIVDEPPAGEGAA